jgi:hypothetical protein
MSNDDKELIDAYFDGCLSDDQGARLSTLLNEDAEARAFLRLRAGMEEHLAELAAAAEAPLPFSSTALDVGGSVPQSRRRWPSSRILWLVAAAAMLVAGVIVPLLDRQAEQEQVAVVQPSGGAVPETIEHSVAVLSGSADAVWEDGDRPVGIAFPLGRVSLLEGLATLAFDNGAQLLLEAPVEIEIKSVDRVVCLSGKLRAVIPDTAHGFTVQSTEFELVDLGTEFAVEVGGAGAQVQVFDGEVEIYPPDSRNRAQMKRLTGGQGLAWAPSGERSEITAQSDSFVSFEEAKERIRALRESRFENWQSWNQRVLDEPHLVVHYDFEDSESVLTDARSNERNGIIVGTKMVAGRWNQKAGRLFRRAERIRIRVPGTFDQLSVAAWIRVNGLPKRDQVVLLGAGESGEGLLCTISEQGRVRVSFPDSTGEYYETEPLFVDQRFETWNLVSVVFDRETRQLSIFLNGRERLRTTTNVDQSVSLGATEIGNGPLNDRSRHLVGAMDSLTIWNKALTPSDVRSLYLSTRP